MEFGDLIVPETVDEIQPWSENGSITCKSDETLYITIRNQNNPDGISGVWF